MEEIKQKALKYYNEANIVLKDEEIKTMEIADFGLGDIENIGLQIITYINTDRYCAKEIAMFPNQTCPEHQHPPRENSKGKQETFRCRYGKVYLYIEGESSEDNIKGTPPEKYKEYYTVFKEVVLEPGDQYTLPPNTKHWFQAGSNGAVVSEFSSSSDDESDIFTNPNINRLANID